MRAVNVVTCFLLVGTRTGPKRGRVLGALCERPRTAGDLAECLGMDASVIDHHLNVLVANGVVRSRLAETGTRYELSDAAEADRGVIESIAERAR